MRSQTVNEGIAVSNMNGQQLKCEGDEKSGDMKPTMSPAQHKQRLSTNNQRLKADKIRNPKKNDGPR